MWESKMELLVIGMLFAAAYKKLKGRNDLERSADIEERDELIRCPNHCDGGQMTYFDGFSKSHKQSECGVCGGAGYLKKS